MNDDEWLRILSLQLIKMIFDDISNDGLNECIKDSIKEIEQRMTYFRNIKLLMRLIRRIEKEPSLLFTNSSWFSMDQLWFKKIKFIINLKIQFWLNGNQSFI